MAVGSDAITILMANINSYPTHVRDYALSRSQLERSMPAIEYFPQAVGEVSREQ